MTPSPSLAYIHTLGCAKNEADSRALERAFALRAVGVVDDPASATHIIINTCGFIADAKEESIAAILEASSQYQEAALVVIGCLVERYREELQEDLPEVEGWFGVYAADEVAAHVAASGHPGSTADSVRSGFAANSFAYLKISDGCDHECSFCAIPAIKGSYRPTRTGDILEQAEAAVDAGARELVLVGQDTALWRDGEVELPDLVDLLSEDDRVGWIRLMYMQPENLDRELVELVAGHRRVCRYLDLPFQHASRRVLKAMRRQGSGDEYLRFLASIREDMSDVSLRSTFIVGFPGETEDEFEELMDFVQAAEFDHAGAFAYSPEEGTAASRLGPPVGEVARQERMNRLSAILLSGTEARNSDLVGDRVWVMLDDLNGEGDAPDGVKAVGRTYRQAPEVDGVTFLEGDLPSGARIGDILPATIVGVAGFDLVAECDEAESS